MDSLFPVRRPRLCWWPCISISKTWPSAGKNWSIREICKANWAYHQYTQQVMSINTTPTAPVTVNGEPLLEFVQDFTYLCSLISKDNGGQKYIKARLGKARCAFAKLQNICKSNQYTSKTKIRLYNSNVNSILLYCTVLASGKRGHGKDRCVP